MDINQSIQKMLNSDYTLERIDPSHTNWFICTVINNNEKESFKFEIKDIYNKNIYHVKLMTVKDFKQLARSFNINLFEIHENIRILKNEFNFLNNFMRGQTLEFETLEEFYQCGILRSNTIPEDFFAFSIDILLDLPHLKTTVSNSYSYFDKISGGVFENNLDDFKKVFLTRYASIILEKPLNELCISDYKVLHMLNI